MNRQPSFFHYETSRLIDFQEKTPKDAQKPVARAIENNFSLKNRQFCHLFDLAKINKKTAQIQGFRLFFCAKSTKFWSKWRDLNPRPLAPEQRFLCFFNTIVYI